MQLSLVVPCYNEEDNIVPFYNKAVESLDKYQFEIIFVNDGSRDKTRERLTELYKKHKDKVSVINFSRNFGKEAAVLAGLRHSTGDYVSIIDADLQQNPEVIVKMVEFLDSHSEYDAVAAYQEERIERKTLSLAKKLFYKLINKVCDIEFYSNASDFRTLRRSVVQALLSMPEYFRFSKGLFSWVGFETHYMPYRVEERSAGQSKWTVGKLIKYAVEGFISFTTLPLKIATCLGIVVSMISIIYMIIVIIQKLCFSIDIPGYPTIIVLILFLAGVQLMILGIIGEYLARVYIQGKNRPVYIIKDLWKEEN